MTFSFLWWLSIVKAPNVKKEKKVTCARYEYIKIEVALFYLPLAFLVKGRKANWNRINKQG